MGLVRRPRSVKSEIILTFEMIERAVNEGIEERADLDARPIETRNGYLSCIRWYHFWYEIGGFAMAITASEARKNLFPLIEKVNDDHTAIEITSKRGSAVLMSLSEYEALEETAHLLRSPVNAERLLESIAQHRAGKAAARQLEE
ncbi:hypothetical protein GCM10027403_19130 [Arthrobacter tecti]